MQHRRLIRSRRSGLGYEAADRIRPPHPGRLYKRFAKGARRKGFKLIIAGAGGARICLG